MARTAKFHSEHIVEAAMRIAAQDGPGHATVARIAGELGAPTGSIYHRFDSRDALLAEVWLTAAERFQHGFGAVLAGEQAWQAAHEAVTWVTARVRAEPLEARILLLHRREDFLVSGWPTTLTERARTLRDAADQGLRGFTRRLFGRLDAAHLRAVRFVLVDAPLAAVQSHLRADESPPPILDRLLLSTCTAVLRAMGAQAPSGPEKR